MVQEGPKVRGNLSTASGAQGGKFVAKHDETPNINLCNNM
jgi:hypothetical protein